MLRKYLMSQCHHLLTNSLVIWYVGKILKVSMVSSIYEFYCYLVC